jgi:hypothetical protein
MFRALTLFSLVVLVGCQPWQDDLAQSEAKMQDLEVRVRLLEKQLEDVQHAQSQQSAVPVVTFEVPTQDLMQIYRTNDSVFNEAIKQFVQRSP